MRHIKKKLYFFANLTKKGVIFIHLCWVAIVVLAAVIFYLTIKGKEV